LTQFIKAFGKMNKKLRILHCPVNVAGLSWNISKAERKLGYDSDCVIFENSLIDYSDSHSLNLDKKNFIARFVIIFLFFLKAIRKYDVFHFYYARTILPFSLDLPILKILGKKLFFTFQGSDIRRRYYFKKHFKIDIYKNCKTIKHSRIFDFFRFLRLKYILFFANKTFILNPDLKLISPSSEMIPYGSVDLEKWNFVSNHQKKDKIVILHAPSNRGIKGTKYVTEAILKLKENGYPVELKIIENTENNKLREFCKEADIVIDQLLIGWYGGFAVEAMALEKPVVSYLNEDLFPFVYFADDIPIINANPNNLYDKLKHLIENLDQREILGKKGRKFVELHHNPLIIAKKLIGEYIKN